MMQAAMSGANALSVRGRGVIGNDAQNCANTWSFGVNRTWRPQPPSGFRVLGSKRWKRRRNVRGYGGGLEEETACRSSILLGIDGIFLDSREKSCTVYSQVCGSTIGTTHAPPACGERSYDLVALLSFIFVSNAGYVGLRICFFSNRLLHLMQVAMRRLLCTRFSEFCERSIKRLAPC